MFRSILNLHHSVYEVLFNLNVKIVPFEKKQNYWYKYFVDTYSTRKNSLDVFINDVIILTLQVFTCSLWDSFSVSSTAIIRENTFSSRDFTFSRTFSLSSKDPCMLVTFATKLDEHHLHPPLFLDWLVSLPPYATSLSRFRNSLPLLGIL